MKDLQNGGTTRDTSPAEEALLRLNSVLEAEDSPAPVDIFVQGTEQTIAIPREIAETLQKVLAIEAAGKSIRVVPEESEFTTQQAADFLNVSRPHVVKLIDEGSLPGYKVGSHRRVRRADLQKYKNERDARQRRAVAELTALSEDLELY
ncbi:helix-turn-helix domain-containing protein [Corynebacterium sp. ACRPE]|uniref:helix-turn-helix domain-containing protein n=1 Tax=Corynebacterium sp. ACRPE TaxID=2918196 RepID=UPI001EF3D8DB|nr:helix-turn-helix domain-containing protein [Corynebacterium sp. ACRPE]MCG7468648.1 helix-turn-helix domain-containing protein [Corynebacterium sp. ACRPE]